MIVFEKEKLRDQNYRQKFYAKLAEINSIRRKNTYIGYATNRQLFEELKELYETNLKDYEASYECHFLKYQAIKKLAQQSHQHIHKAHFPALKERYEAIEEILEKENYEENVKAASLIAELEETLNAYLEEYKGWEDSLAEMHSQLKTLKTQVWAEDYDDFCKKYETQQRKVRGRILPGQSVTLGEEDVTEARKRKQDNIQYLRTKAGNNARLLEKIAALETEFHTYKEGYQQVAKAVEKRVKVRVAKLSISGALVLGAIIALAIIGPELYSEYQEERRWILARDSNTYQSYSYYLKDYPYGEFAPMAQKARLQLKKGTITGLVSATEGPYTYTGDLNRGQPHGKGKAVYENGGVYEGDWENGIRIGEGVFTETNGMVYEGAWREGQRHGIGKQIWQSGDVYEGSWVAGERQGEGTLTRADGSKYIGNWDEGKLHGKGTFTYSEGSKYIGSWKAGLRHGKGVYYFKDGSKYEGNWKEDAREGYGTMRWKDGRVYRGGWRSNQRSGKGKITWPNGSNYDGQWTADKINGLGTFNSRLREPFTGRWETLEGGKMVVYDNSGLILRKGSFQGGLFMPDNANR